MRTHYCGELNSGHIGQEIELCGWVHRRRDHGGVIFLDLRDRAGLAQIVFDPDRAESFAIADSVRNEFVIKITGKVRHRPEGTINSDLTTGEIEILGHAIEILNKSKTPPIQIDDEHVHDDIKLRYRYIDLRRSLMQKNLQLRSKIVKELRAFLDNKGFLDIETPMLTKATPEGARDYLVPSRTQPGNFFALPQSPQLFKQLLMIAGMDRYYQIVRCFRDEDLRADRQPEFTQLDIETSFLNEDDITSLMEEMIDLLFKKVLDIKLPSPFPRMSYQEAMNRYGSDRPDIRNPLELINGFLWFSKYKYAVCTLTLGDCMESLNLNYKYYFIWLFFKLPMLVFIGLVLFPFTEKKIFSQPVNQIIFGSILLTIISIIFLLIFFEVNLYDELRHILFLVPLILIASFSIIYFFSKKLLLYTTFISIFVFVIQNINMYPYQYTWFNSFGNFININNNFEVDYWGVSGRNIAKKINNNNQLLQHKDKCIYVAPKHVIEPFISTDYNCVKSFFSIYPKSNEKYILE